MVINRGVPTGVLYDISVEKDRHGQIVRVANRDVLDREVIIEMFHLK